MNLISLDGRLATFKKNKWPHPARFKANPTTLAQAGFYSRPLLPDSPDNVACVYCRKNLDQWAEGDEAWTEHVKHGATCPLVRVGELDGREMTFLAGGWPHEGSIGAAGMAKAGFFYWPIANGSVDDTAVCVQCGLSLDGWEPNDDPHHEHARRRPQCPLLLTGKLVQPAFAHLFLASLDTSQAIREHSKSDDVAAKSNKENSANSVVSSPAKDAVKRESVPKSAVKSKAAAKSAVKRKSSLKSESIPDKEPLRVSIPKRGSVINPKKARESVVSKTKATRESVVGKTRASRESVVIEKEPMVEVKTEPKETFGSAVESAVKAARESVVPKKKVEETPRKPPSTSTAAKRKSSIKKQDALKEAMEKLPNVKVEDLELTVEEFLSQSKKRVLDDFDRHLRTLIEAANCKL